MDLQKIFEKQKALMERIEKEHPVQPGENRFAKRLLALLVETGECANEYRGFKFWSKDQNPRTRKARAPYMDLEDAEFYNPLLEEFVDKLHFAVELGIEIGIEKTKIDVFFKYDSITEQYLEVYEKILVFRLEPTEYRWLIMIKVLLGLGEMLGFSSDEIEQAYLQKNAVNHARQDGGY